ncbi:MAG: hypothetical protein ABI402_11005 [Ferruginibacter sp.]
MIDQIIPFEKMKFGLLRRLSKCLDISFPEVTAIYPLLIPVFNNRKVIKYYVVSFGEGAPVIILNKIKKLSDSNTVCVGYYSINELLPLNKTKKMQL